MSLRRWIRQRNPVYRSARGKRRPQLSRCLCFESLENRDLMSAGSLDSTFGIGGIVTTDMRGNSGDTANAMAIQSDGKIVVAGSASVSSSDFALARYNADGSLDSSFGTGGKVITDVFGFNDHINALAIQSDGKIIVGGTAQQIVAGHSARDYLLARYDADGTLDATFGNAGIVSTDFGSDSLDEVNSIAIQLDGKIIAVGASLFVTDHVIGLARYNIDGTLDGTFGVEGKVTNAFIGFAGAIAIQSNGQIVVAGSPFNNNFPLARFNNDGSLDNSFGSGPGGTSTLFVDDLAIQDDGKIVAAGQGGNGEFTVARYTTGGILDSTFGMTGETTLGFFGLGSAATGIAIQTDGKIVAAGYANRDHTGAFDVLGDFAVARFTANGTLDSTFGVGGQVTTDLLHDEFGADIAVQADGKIVVAGIRFSELDTVDDFAIVRYEGDSTPPPSAPADLVLNAGTIREGDGFTLTGSFSDPDTADVHTVTIDWGPGEGSTTITLPVGQRDFAVSHPYLDDNPTGTPFDAYWISVTVIDDDGGSVSASTQVTVNNAAPANLNVNLGSGLTYSMTVLGTLGGSYSAAYGINNLGQIIGEAALADESVHAFLHSAGTMTDLGTLGGTNSGAFGINDAGQVVGVSLLPGDVEVHAFVYSSGSMIDLGTLGGSNSGASDINSAGQVVGGADLMSGLRHAFLYSAGIMTDLGTLGGSESAADDINDAGQVVGGSRTADGATHAFLYAAGTMTDLGTLGGSFSQAGGINNDGQVVGVSSTSANLFHAFLFTAGSMTDLGTLGGSFSQAYDINDAGQIVGESTPLGSTESRAFLYSNGTMFDLNDLMPGGSGLTLQIANAINSAGQIAAIAVDSEGVLYAVLLTPEPPLTAVDENGVVTLHGNFTDPGVLDTHVVTVDWGDGTSETITLTMGAREFAVTHQYLDDAPSGSSADDYSIKVTVTDDDGGVGNASTAITVTNLSPQVAPLIGPNTAVAGQMVSLATSFTDVGTLDTHTAVIDWGDGNITAGAVTESSGSGSVNGSHVYEAPGAYTVTLTVADDDGGATSVTTTITVTQVAIQIDTCDPTKTQLVVGGTTADDTIVVSPVGASAVEVQLNGASLGTFSPTGRIVVFARAGNDDVRIAGSINNSAWLFGGQGHDRLKGGGGNDVLLGGEGEDLLVGGEGRDLLVGGYGSDRIVGNADDDILISGITDHDASEAALCQIMDEWIRTDADFATRVSHLKGPDGGGLSGGENGTFFLNSATVHDDGCADVLTGSSGNDWFLFNQDGDGDAAKDKVTDMQTFESMFSQDIDFIDGAC